jgi:hypothetical protein
LALTNKVLNAKRSKVDGGNKSNGFFSFFSGFGSSSSSSSFSFFASFLTSFGFSSFLAYSLPFPLSSFFSSLSAAIPWNGVLHNQTFPNTF